MTFFRDLAERSKREAAQRLDRGFGIKGKLKRLKNPNRKIGGSLPGVIRKASVTVTEEGFVERHTDPRLVAFHDGEPESNQPPRPVIGIPDKNLPLYARAVADELEARAKRMGLV